MRKDSILGKAETSMSGIIRRSHYKWLVRVGRGDAAQHRGQRVIRNRGLLRPPSGGPNKASEVARSLYRVRLAESDFGPGNCDSYTTVRPVLKLSHLRKRNYADRWIPSQDSTRSTTVPLEPTKTPQTTKTATADLLRRFPGFESLVSASQSPGCIWIYRP